MKSYRWWKAPFEMAPFGRASFWKAPFSKCRLLLVCLELAVSGLACAGTQSDAGSASGVPPFVHDCSKPLSFTVLPARLAAHRCTPFSVDITTNRPFLEVELANPTRDRFYEVDLSGTDAIGTKDSITTRGADEAFTLTRLPNIEGDNPDCIRARLTVPISSVYQQYTVRASNGFSGESVCQTYPELTARAPAEEITFTDKGECNRLQLNWRSQNADDEWDVEAECHHFTVKGDRTTLPLNKTEDHLVTVKPLPTCAGVEGKAVSASWKGELTGACNLGPERDVLTCPVKLTPASSAEPRPSSEPFPCNEQNCTNTTGTVATPMIVYATPLTIALGVSLVAVCTIGGIYLVYKGTRAAYRWFKGKRPVPSAENDTVQLVNNAHSTTSLNASPVSARRALSSSHKPRQNEFAYP